MGVVVQESALRQVRCSFRMLAHVTLTQAPASTLQAQLLAFFQQ
jgi:hypothetical protein